MQFVGFAVLICLVQTIDYSFACKGFDVELISIANGPNNPTVVVRPDPKLFLDPNCQLYLEGCLVLSKSVTDAQLSFKAKKNGILTVLDANNIDVCQLLTTSNYPKRCPLVQGEYCEARTNPFNVSNQINYLARVLGRVTLEATVITNKSEVNVFILELSVFLRR